MFIAAIKHKPLWWGLQFTDGKGIKRNMHASCYRGGCKYGWAKKNMLNRPIHLSSQDAKERLNTLYIFIYLTCRILTQYFLLLLLGRFVDSLMYREGCPPDYDFDPSKCLFYNYSFLLQIQYILISLLFSQLVVSQQTKNL